MYFSGRRPDSKNPASPKFDDGIGRLEAEMCDGVLELFGNPELLLGWSDP